MIINLIQWTNTVFNSIFGLFILAFIESIFFPVPVDPFLINLTLENNKGLLLALIVLVGSVLGSIVSYYIGLKIGKPLLMKVMDLERIHKFFNKYQAYIIFIAAFTPLSFKIFAIFGGVFYINFRKFIIATIFGKGLRYFLIVIFVMIFKDINFMKSFDYMSFLCIIPLFCLFIYQRSLRNK